MKAIVLLSGGLDSTLAARLIKEQGIELVGLNFKTPFCLCDRGRSAGCASFSRQLATDLKIEFKVFNVTEEFLQLLPHPKYGYGAQMNPCIDCRILKFRKAKEYMRKISANFIVTGEVVGQRPMSQNKNTLMLIDRESDLEGLVLRPLSARLLPETIPEREGWVRREKLLDFSGRWRRPQMDLAERLHIKDYPCPAGGCLLTDPEFAKKVKDLIKYGELGLNDIELLKAGRYFRFAESAKLIVGRNEKENMRLQNLAQEGDILFSPLKIAGPTALGRGRFSEELVKFSAEVVCWYCDLNGMDSTDISYSVFSQGQNTILKVFPVEPHSTSEVEKVMR